MTGLGDRLGTVTRRHRARVGRGLRQSGVSPCARTTRLVGFLTGLLLVALGALLLYAGGEFLVRNASHLARAMGMSVLTVGLTVNAKVLRFANTVWNAGEGPLEVRGETDEENNEATFYLKIDRDEVERVEASS